MSSKKISVFLYLKGKLENRKKNSNRLSFPLLVFILAGIYLPWRIIESEKKIIITRWKLNISVTVY